MKITASRDVDAPAERLWAALVDIDGAPQILSGVDAVQRLDGGGELGVGTRWRETRTMMGRQATEEMEVVALDPGRSYTVRSVSGGTTYESVMTVEPCDTSRSRATMSFRATTRSMVGRLLTATVGRLFAGATRRMLRQDLEDLAHAARTRSGPDLGGPGGI